MGHEKLAAEGYTSLMVQVVGKNKVKLVDIEAPRGPSVLTSRGAGT